MNDPSKIHCYQAETEYQIGRHEIRVLAPDDYRADKKYRTLYVLPVATELFNEHRDPLVILKQLNAQNRYQLIMVEMGFENEPWFGDHATDPKIRQASYLKEYVVPFIERSYSTPSTSEGRLLFGFSKSGWGAFSLILHDPDFYGYAAAWDAPLMFPDFRFAMKDIYGTQNQLDRWRPDLLILKQRAHFLKRTRLVLTGEKFWGMMSPAPGGGSHTIEAHELLVRAGVPHFYDNTLTAEHRWDKQWMAPTLKALMDLATSR